MMDFAIEHEKYVRYHAERRTGERLRRLLEGHSHAEILFLQNVWWPLLGHFQDLHPEYEVKDFQDGTRYVDFAYVRPPHRISFEIDGYGPHARDIDRMRFGDNLMRQNQLVLDGWKVFRFSYDDITHKQRRCQQFIMHIIGRWYGDRTMPLHLTHRELEIARLAAVAVEPVKPKDIAGKLGMRVEHARKWLHRLCAKGVLRPASGDRRVRAYVLDSAGKKLFI